jgi:septum formation protein
VASRYEERDAPGVDPADQVAEHARGKALEVAARSGMPEAGAVLGADTIVVAEGRVLGKPADPREALQMLSLLAGREHEVMSAATLVTPAGPRTALGRTAVRFRQLDRAALDWYLATGEWRERAGAYAIQGAGAALVERLDGDYTTVVGLPMAALVRLLEGAGLAPWSGS